MSGTRRDAGAPWGWCGPTLGRSGKTGALWAARDRPKARQRDRHPGGGLRCIAVFASCRAVSAPARALAHCPASTPMADCGPRTGRSCSSSRVSASAVAVPPGGRPTASAASASPVAATWGGGLLSSFRLTQLMPLLAQRCLQDTGCRRFLHSSRCGLANSQIKHNKSACC